MELVPTAIAGVFSVVILYFLSLFFILGPSLGMSNREVYFIRSTLRKISGKKFDGFHLTLKEIGTLCALERVSKSILSLDIRCSSALITAVSGISSNAIGKEINSLRQHNRDVLIELLEEIFTSEDSVNQIYTRARRKLLHYRIKSRLLGLNYFLLKILPRSIDRWGRYVTITAIMAVVIGYSTWFLNGENGTPGTNILVNKSIDYLSIGALVSIIIAAISEIFLGAHSLYTAKVLNRFQLITFSATAILLLAAMVLASIFFKINYISFALSLVKLVRVPNSIEELFFTIITLLAIYYSARQCYRKWKNTLYSLSLKITSLTTTVFSISIFILLALEQNKLSYTIFHYSSLTLIILLIFLLLINLVETIIDIYRKNFHSGKSGIFAFSSLFLSALSAIILICSYNRSLKLSSCVNSECKYNTEFSLGYIILFIIFSILLLFAIIILTFSCIKIYENYGKYQEAILSTEKEFNSEYYRKDKIKTLLKEVKEEHRNQVYS